MPDDAAASPASASTDESTDHDERGLLPKWRIIAALLLFLIVAIATVVFWLDDIGVLRLAAWRDSLGPWWLNDGWPWMSDWLSSPGFGGLAVVVAAAFALAGARHQARLNAWWQRVEWALGLYVKHDAKDLERRAGAAAIEALVSSRLAKSDERIFLGQVVEAVTLDPLGDGLERDDWSAGSSEADQDAVDGEKRERDDRGFRRWLALLLTEGPRHLLRR